MKTCHPPEYYTVSVPLGWGHALGIKVLDGLIMGTSHLELGSCIAGQTENPLIKIPSIHREALKSKSVLEIFKLQSQVELVILLKMGECVYNTLRRPKSAEVTFKKNVPSQCTPQCGKKSSEHQIISFWLVVCTQLKPNVFLFCFKWQKMRGKKRNLKTHINLIFLILFPEMVLELI